MHYSFNKSQTYILSYSQTRLCFVVNQKDLKYFLFKNSFVSLYRVHMVEGTKRAIEFILFRIYMKLRVSVRAVFFQKQSNSVYTSLSKLLVLSV